MAADHEDEPLTNGPGLNNLLREVKIAIGFLTLFRANVSPVPNMVDVGRSSWAFPVAGAMIGVILCLFYGLCSFFFPQTVCALLAVILWVVLTGGLHLDGWTDCWDALGASVSMERRRDILKDSRLGAFGAIGLILLLLAKVVTVMFMKTPVVGIFVAPVIGRAMMILASQGALTPGHGMAKDFLDGVQRKSCIFCWVLSILVALFAGFSGLLSVIAAFGASVWFRRFAESRIGFVNGDVLGSICELSEVTVLIIICSK
ncbi:MAG: adenosylcobinamide-GDP ribazoletransferase [Syntrophaceae bacterium]|nr:adenosylcobinamide-GDP ribazoletransferase [Syntrophaceae bacterium]